MSAQARRSIWRFVAILAVFVMGLAGSAAAQNVGTVTGTVKDPQGLAIPGATVMLANRVSQTRQEAVADDTGRFTFANVPYGPYVLTGSLSGFAPVEQVVDVRSTVPLIRDVELRVGGLTETVNVTADALLEASSVGSRVALGASLIDQLPTATPSRQVGSMLLSAPGFIPS